MLLHVPTLHIQCAGIGGGGNGKLGPKIRQMLRKRNLGFSKVYGAVIMAGYDLDEFFGSIIFAQITQNPHCHLNRFAVLAVQQFFFVFCKFHVDSFPCFLTLPQRG